MNAFEFIKTLEGCRLTAYPDPESPRGQALQTGHDDPTLDASPWTIGFGHTGPDVVEGLTWTQAQADAALAQRVAHDQHVIEAMCPAPRTESEMAALCALVYNIGLGAKGFETSTVRRELNNGHLLAAADAFRLWNKSRGKVVQGLINRREKERTLFLSDLGVS